MRRRTAVAVAAAGFLLASCSESSDGAIVLKESLESIGNEMMALHEPRRVVEYHDRSGQPFWIAVIPRRTDRAAPADSGTASDPQCPRSDLTTLAVGGSQPTRCVTLPRLTASERRLVHKGARATVRITLDLDTNGYRVVDIK